VTSSDHRHSADWPADADRDRSRAGQTWRTYDAYVLVINTFMDEHSKGKWLWHNIVIISDATHPQLEGKHEKVAEMLQDPWKENGIAPSWERVG
jgi:hypothetical protein